MNLETLETLETSGSVVGNSRTTTELTSKKRIVPGKKWCGTYNNYTMEDLETLKKRYELSCVKWVIGEEVGEKGTPHLQMALVSENDIRPTEKFGFKCIHWEKMKGTVEQAFKYCMKEGKYTGKDLPKIPKPLKLISPNRPYQKFILDEIKKEANERHIYWFWDEKGNVGKSQFCKYLVVKHNALLIDEGGKRDLANLVFNYYEKWEEVELVIIDVPRANKNKVSYKAIESIKSGLIVNTKYETGQCVFNSPHIFIFANYPPETNGTLSLDRFLIYEISNIDYNFKKCDVANEKEIEGDI